MKKINYDELIHSALINVVKKLLQQVAVSGLPGEHHFFISFNTCVQGVKIPDFLKETYPTEMTIVLQHQYWDMKVDDEKLQVSLSFDSKPTSLHIPLASITSFFDPSVNFCLQFKPEGNPPGPPLKSGSVGLISPVGGDKSDKKSNIIDLDKFRKK